MSVPPSNLRAPSHVFGVDESLLVPALYPSLLNGGGANVSSTAAPAAAAVVAPVSAAAAAAPFANTYMPFSTQAVLHEQAEEQLRYNTGLPHLLSAPVASFNPLRAEEEQGVMRAVHLDMQQPMIVHNQHWEHSADIMPMQAGLEGWGAVHKPSLLSVSQQKAEGVATFLPPTSLLRTTSAPAAPIAAPILVSMPLFLESTCFSLRLSDMAPQQMWEQVQQQLQRFGIFTSEKKEKSYQLDCCSTASSCTEFRVQMCAGHFKDCGSASALASSSPSSSSSSSSSYYTVEFQRRAGCCMSFMQLFRVVLRELNEANEAVTLDSKISPALSEAMEGNPAADPLAMPSLLPSISLTSEPMAAVSPCIQNPCASLFDSLLDMLTSSDPACHLDSMNALALCISGTHPEKEAQLLKEVAAKLQNGECEKVRQVAANLIAKAAALPSAAGTVLQACLPAMVASITPAPAAHSSADAACLAARVACARQKALLRSCLALSSSFPEQFHDCLLDGQGNEGAIRSSRWKRQLLQLSAGATDAELRSLASSMAIQV